MLNHRTNPTRTFHVADLAKEANVTPATIRYYARTGLIHPRRDPDNGYRCFVGEDVRRIAFIRQAKALGLTINDIKTILDATDRGEECFVEVKSIVERRLAQIRNRITELEANEARISRAISSWEQIEVQTPVNGGLYPLIEQLDRFNGKAPIWTLQRQ